MVSPRGTIEVTAFNGEMDGIRDYGTNFLVNAIDSLIAVRDSIPAEFRSRARLSIYDDCVTVSYNRPEADEEYNQRLEALERAAKKRKKSEAANADKARKALEKQIAALQKKLAKL